MVAKNLNLYTPQCEAWLYYKIRIKQDVYLLKKWVISMQIWSLLLQIFDIF